MPLSDLILLDLVDAGALVGVAATSDSLLMSDKLVQGSLADGVGALTPPAVAGVVAANVVSPPAAAVDAGVRRLLSAYRS